jgi:hypothetical protein
MVFYLVNLTPLAFIVLLCKTKDYFFGQKYIYFDMVTL